MSQLEVVGAVEELQSLRRMQEDLEAEIAGLQDRIKAHMTEAGIDQMSAGAFKVTWKNVSSSRFDGTAFRKDFPDIATEYPRQSVTKRFVVA